jgi:transposase
LGPAADWAWRRNHRYASIICNLERRRIVTLLPDREPATAQAWLAARPAIAVVARDRGGGYRSHLAVRIGLMNSTPSKSFSLSVTTTQSFALAMAAMMVSSVNQRPTLTPQIRSQSNT